MSEAPVAIRIGRWRLAIASMMAGQVMSPDPTFQAHT